MKLESLRFHEFLAQQREWVLHECSFGTINLIVGKNASGKTRLLNVINGLARMLRGDLKQVYQSGHYEVKWSSGTDSYSYELDIADHQVRLERLIRNETMLLDRGDNGVGRSGPNAKASI